MTDKLIVNDNKENLIVNPENEILKTEDSQENVVINDSQEHLNVNETIENLVVLEPFTGEGGRTYSGPNFRAVPAAPNGLVAVPVGSHEVNLLWAYSNSAGLKYTEVWRSTTQQVGGVIPGEPGGVISTDYSANIIQFDSANNIQSQTPVDASTSQAFSLTTYGENSVAASIEFYKDYQFEVGQTYVITINLANIDCGTSWSQARICALQNGQRFGDLGNLGTAMFTSGQEVYELAGTIVNDVVTVEFTPNQNFFDFGLEVGISFEDSGWGSVYTGSFSLAGLDVIGEGTPDIPIEEDLTAIPPGAVKVGYSNNNLFIDTLPDTDQTYYYWVRAVDFFLNVTEFNAFSGVQVDHDGGTNSVLNSLLGNITYNHLDTSLQASIDNITVIQSNLAQEVTDRQNDIAQEVVDRDAAISSAISTLDTALQNLITTSSAAAEANANTYTDSTVALAQAQLQANIDAVANADLGIDLKANLAGGNEFDGDQKVLGKVTVSATVPTLWLEDTSVDAYNFGMQGNNDNLYLVADTNNDGVVDEYLMQLRQSDTTGFIFGQKIQTDSNSYTNAEIDTLLESAGGGGSTSFSREETFGVATDTFSVAYLVGQIEVYLNGALLSESEYTATDEATVVLTDGPVDVDDVVTFVTWQESAAPGSVFPLDLGSIATSADNIYDLGSIA